MKIRMASSAATSVAVGLLSIASAQVSAQTGIEQAGGTRAELAGRQGGPPPAVSRTSEGTPDMQGFWVPDAPATNYLEEHPGGYAIRAGKSVIVDPADGKIPYQEWALRERDARRRPESSYDDPELHCFLSGVPRQMYVTGLSGYQILQPAGHVVILFEYIHANRVISLKSSAHLPEGIHKWEGDSIGHWEGDTLVVDTRNNNGKTWMELSGDFYSAAAHIVERFTMVNGSTINYQATIDDPTVYTRPWTLALHWNRVQQPKFELLEQACHEENQDLSHIRAVKEAKTRSTK